MFSPVKGVSKKIKQKISQTHRSFKNKHFPNSVTFDKREINGTIKSTIPRVDSYALSIPVRNTTTVFARKQFFKFLNKLASRFSASSSSKGQQFFRTKIKTTHTVTKSDCFTRQGFNKKKLS